MATPKTRRASDAAPITRVAYTVPEFCIAYRISRALLYKLAPDRRPAFTKIGTRTIITIEDADTWQQSLTRHDATR